MTARGWSLRELYRTLDTPGENPSAPLRPTSTPPSAPPYAMPPDTDLLAFLLALNLELAAKEKDGKTITPPGLPLPESERDAFVTTDCILI